MKNTEKGFTLIELLLYLGMTVIMVVLIGGIGVNVLSSVVSAREQEELQYNGQFIIEKLNRVIGEADSIVIPARLATSSVLTLQMNTSSVVIDVLDGNMRIKEGSDEAQVISGSNIIIQRVEFSNVTYENGTEALRVVIDVDLKNSESLTVGKSFMTTINL